MVKRYFLTAIIIAIVAALALISYKAGIIKTPEKTEPPGKIEPIETAVSNEPPRTAQEMPAEEEALTVEITPEMQQRIGVKTEEARVVPLRKVIRTVGRIEADERRVFAVTTKFEGWIEKLHANYTGRFVRKGEPLAELYSPELLATQEEFLVALKWATAGDSKDSEALLEAAKWRLRLWDISEAQIKRLEETGQAMRTLKIHSPASGYVVEKMALEGVRVMPGDLLFTIADLSTVWVMTDIYEYELGFIKPGQKAEISLSYLPGVRLLSKVDYVYPTLSAETRTAKVRFEASNPGLKLRPQMFADVEVTVDLGKRLAVPEEAVIDTGERQVVYVDKGEGYFEPREIKTGIRAEGMREVLKGLKPGERVAASATFLIDSEAQIKGVKPLKK